MAELLCSKKIPEFSVFAFGDQKPFLKKRFLDFQKTLGAGWKEIRLNAFARRFGKRIQNCF